MSRIRVTIDQLALNGFAAGDRKPLIEQLQTELSRLLANPADRAEWALSHRTPVLRLGRIAMEAGPAAGRKFGGELARSIARGLKP
jgi:hypothetical protein